MHRKVLMIAVVLLAAATASADTNFTCESVDGKYRECRVPGTGQIVMARQLSDTTCVQGQNWGVRDGVLWVNSGCRAEFRVVASAVQPTIGIGNTSSRFVVCESENGRRNVCPAATSGGVSIVQQLSNSACVEGRTWGHDARGIWVDEGCRAEFVVGTSQFAARPIETLDTMILCESIDRRTNRCAADTTGGVHLTRRVSDSPCRFGEDWGYDVGGVWVANGCRAEFAVRSSVPVQNASTVAPMAPAIVCESQNNRRAECPTDTRFGVMLRRQISESPCVRGETWGVDSRGIWVNEGCRGEFVLGSGDVAMTSSAPSRIAQNPAPTIICESIENRRSHCHVDTRYGITLVRQMSDSACVRGETWGVDENGIWVTRGCRAEFAFGDSPVARPMTPQPAMTTAPMPPMQTVVCESIEGRRNHCQIDARGGVRLVRQLSDADCVLNSTWGFDANGIWVTKGCRAEFGITEHVRVEGRLSDAPRRASVVCESIDGKRNVCPADMRLGVAVVRQLSDSPCVLNSTWGFDAEGIWVTAGCRAEFILRR